MPKPGPAGDDARPSAGSGVALFATANLVVTATALIVAPLLARLLGPDGRGKLGAAMSLFVVLRSLAPIGLAEASTRSFEWREDLTPRILLRAAAPVAIGAGIILGIITWFLAPTFFGGDDTTVDAFRLISFFLPIYAGAEVLRALLIVTRDYRVAASMLASPFIVRLIGVLALLAFGVADVRWVALISIVGMLLVVPAAIRSVMRGERGPDVDIGELRRRLVGFGSRAVLGAATALADRRLDQVLLLSIAGDVANGLYVVAVAVAELPDIIQRSVRGVLLAEGSADIDDAGFARVFRSSIVAIALVSIALALLTPIVVPLAFGRDFEGSVMPALILILAGLPLAMSALGGIGLYLADRPGTYAIVRTVSVVVNVVLLYTLASRHGAVGAAIASLISYSVATALTLTMVARLTTLGLGDLLRWRKADIDAGLDQIARVVRRFLPNRNRTNPS